MCIRDRYGEALEAMQTVLSLSVDHDDHSGETDALGVIADIYTDMDQLEIASEYYDRYFQSLQEEDALNAAKEAAEEKAVARGGVQVLPGFRVNPFASSIQRTTHVSRVWFTNR